MKAKHFQTEAPANTKKLYPAYLEVAPGPGIQKAYVYRPGNSPSMEWEIGDGSIRNPTSNQCLAARGQYMPPATGIAGVQIWAKPLGNGKTAALFINGGSSEYSATISLAELNITATDSGTVTVQDVWSGADAGRVQNGQWNTGNVPSMDSRFVVFSSRP